MGHGVVVVAERGGERGEVVVDGAAVAHAAAVDEVVAGQREEPVVHLSLLGLAADRDDGFGDDHGHPAVVAAHAMAAILFEGVAGQRRLGRRAVPSGGEEDGADRGPGAGRHPVSFGDEVRPAAAEAASSHRRVSRTPGLSGSPISPSRAAVFPRRGLVELAGQEREDGSAGQRSPAAAGVAEVLGGAAVALELGRGGRVAELEQRRGLEQLGLGVQLAVTGERARSSISATIGRRSPADPTDQLVSWRARRQYARVDGSSRERATSTASTATSRARSSVPGSQVWCSSRAKLASTQARNGEDWPARPLLASSSSRTLWSRDRPLSAPNRWVPMAAWAKPPVSPSWRARSAASASTSRAPVASPA